MSLGQPGSAQSPVLVASLAMLQGISVPHHDHRKVVVVGDGYGLRVMGIIMCGYGDSDWVVTGDNDNSGNSDSGSNDDSDSSSNKNFY